MFSRKRTWWKLVKFLLATGVSRGAAIAFASGDKNVNYDTGTYSQGNIVTVGAFNKLKNNNIKLGNEESIFLLRMYGSPTKKSTMVAFKEIIRNIWRNKISKFSKCRKSKE